VPPSPPAEKATARQDQAGETSTGDGFGDGGDRATAERTLTDQTGREEISFMRAPR